MSQKSFRILCRGRWQRHQLAVRFLDKRYVLPAIHSERSFAYWQKIKASGARFLFNGELFRLEGLVPAPSQLEVVLSRTCYRDQMYSNAHVAGLLAAHGESSLARGLGVSALVFTGDGCLALMRRSEKLGEQPGRIDVIGGHAHPDQHLIGGTPDLFRAISDEVEAELGLAPSKFVHFMCCGVVENSKTYKPDLVFALEVGATMAEVKQAASTAAESDEIAEMLAVRATPDSISEFVEQNETMITPAALGCLSMMMNP